MYKFIKLPIVNIVLFLILGIIIADKLDLNLNYAYNISIIIFLFSLGFILIFFHKLKFQSPNITILLSIIFLLLGFSLHKFNNSLEYKKNHYINQAKEFNNVYVKVYEINSRKSKKTKYLAKILSINSNKSYGNILIHIRDSISYNIDINDVLFIPNAKLNSIKFNKNPYDFDYSKYMYRQKVYRVIYAKGNSIKRISTENSYFKSLEKFKSLVFDRLNKYLSDQEAAVLQSLVLGDRRGLSQSTIDSYNNAGIMHILAISGLHIGIIFLILSRIFSFLNNFKNGKIVVVFIILSILWVYASLIGFKSSVVRATLMLSFYLIGKFINQRSNSLHLMLISAFFLLVIDTNNLFSIGFQFSYLAVLGILIFNSHIYSLIKSKYRIINFPLSIISVSLSCQLALSPLVIYYFNKLSILFLLSGLVVIPVLPIIIILGFIIIALVYSQIYINILFYLYDSILYYTNYYIRFISSFENLILDDVSWNIIMVFLAYAIIIFLYIYINSKKLIYLNASFFILILFNLVYLLSYIKTYNIKELIIYDTRNYSLISIKNKNNMYVFTDSKNNNKQISKIINPYKLKNKISNCIILDMEDTIRTNLFIKKKNFIAFGNDIFYIYKNKHNLITKDKKINFIITKRYRDIKSIIKSNKNNYFIVNNNLIKDNLDNYIKENNIKIYKISKQGFFSFRI